MDLFVPDVPGKHNTRNSKAQLRLTCGKVPKSETSPNGRSHSASCKVDQPEVHSLTHIDMTCLCACEELRRIQQEEEARRAARRRQNEASDVIYAPPSGGLRVLHCASIVLIGSRLQVWQPAKIPTTTRFWAGLALRLSLFARAVCVKGLQEARKQAIARTGAGAGAGAEPGATDSSAASASNRTPSGAESHANGAGLKLCVNFGECFPLSPGDPGMEPVSIGTSKE